MMDLIPAVGLFKTFKNKVKTSQPPAILLLGN